MALSNETKKTRTRKLVRPENDYYPDRSATDLSITGESTYRLPFDYFPRTTADVSAAFTWQYGDDPVDGSFAKNMQYYKEYKKDIEKAASEKNQYKDLYINTFKPVGPQLKGEV